MGYEIFILLVIFQIKHFICDYPLQNQYMLGKMQANDWIRPLAAHAITHSVGTGLIALIFAPHLTLLLIFADFVLHFIVDRLKASPTLGGRWKPEQPYFWWALGADQMTHHIVNYVFIYIILNY